MMNALLLLHELEQGSARYSKSYYVRSLTEREEIPQFGHGIAEIPMMDKEWIWVGYSYSTDEPIAILVAAPMQGVAMLLRLFVKDSASSHVLVGLFRKSLADICNRGYTRYAVFLGDDNKAKAKLLRLVNKAGGEVIPGTFIMAHGPSDISKW